MEVCGFGFINDHGTTPKYLQWTTLMGVAFSVCTGGNALKICTKWDYRISNICDGDSGKNLLDFLPK